MKNKIKAIAFRTAKSQSQKVIWKANRLTPYNSNLTVFNYDKNGNQFCNRY